MAHDHYVSNELVHWTGRGKSDEQAFATLRTICEEEVLRLTFCPTYVQPDYKPESAVVCFTDIPLRYSHEHCGLFGRFGIGFKKSRMIKYGANPALYTTSTHLSRILQFAQLLERMKDLEKDREWREVAERYFFTEDETVALIEVAEFLQEYSYQNNDDADYVTYYQREWRLAFNSLTFAGGSKAHLPGMSCIYIRDGKSFGIFRFAPSDVEFIIVPLRHWWRARALANRLGCKLKVYEFQVMA